MERAKKRGLIFIIIGVLIPVVLLFRVTGFSPQKGIVHNIYAVTIKIHDNTNIHRDSSGILRFVPHRVPYRFIVALGVFLVFLGIRDIEGSKYKNKE